jgi:hypothetical protein
LRQLSEASGLQHPTIHPTLGALTAVECTFHGGDTGSNPRGDANLSLKPRETLAAQSIISNHSYSATDQPPQMPERMELDFEAELEAAAAGGARNVAEFCLAPTSRLSQ